jgi:hypothetical protein
LHVRPRGVAEWDSATRSLLDGIRIFERVAAKGAMLKALDRQWLDLTTPLGRGIMAFLSALAEDERARILAMAVAQQRENEALSSVSTPNSRPIKSARPQVWLVKVGKAYALSLVTITSATQPYHRAGLERASSIA